MNSKLKKGLIISLSVFIVLIATLMILPFAFKGKIMIKAKSQINAMLNARVDFDDIDMSFIRSFPNASIQFENFRIVGINEFEKDTLFASENIDLVLNIKSLFSDTGYEIRKLQINNSQVLAHILPNGMANWNVMKVDSLETQPDTAAMSFNLKLKDFVIKNANITYWDEEGNQKAVLQNLNHHTSGDFTADSSLLVTKTTIDTLTYTMDGIDYLHKADAELNANINANLNDMIFTFSENSSRINAIPFSFAGWFKMLDDGYDMDLTLNAEKVDFKAILSMIPAIYATNFEGVKAGGDVNMSGFLKGKMIGDFYPAFDFKLTAVKGWFQYPALPQSLQNININGHITNPGKTLDETVIEISEFSFLMGKNPFKAQMRVAYPMSDPELMLTAVGKIDLANVKDIYPLETGTKLNGLLDMNLKMGGRMSWYDNNMYDKFTFAGNMNINDMIVQMSSLAQTVSIDVAKMTFNTRYADLFVQKMKIGRNDLTLNGKLENFVAYALHDKTLTGTMNMQSDYFNVSDFMSAEETATVDTTKMTIIEIPKNVNFTMQADFKKLVYDKMNFSNASGILKIADGEMRINNMALQAFGGNMTMNGLYSTSDPKKPKVDFNLNINEVLFSEVFKQVETIQKFAPVFEKASGKFSTKLSFNSLLQNDMMPDMASFLGDGSFNTKSVGLENVPVLTALAEKLKRSELASTTIKDLGLLFEIKEGKLITKPFNLKIADVNMNLSGSTGLDKSIAYTGKLQLPDKLKLGKFSTVDLKVGGTFAKPKVELDLSSMLNSIVTDTKAKVEAEVNKKVDNAKAKALEEARIQKENAIKKAQAEADKIREEAKRLGDKLIDEAKTQGDNAIAKTNNPLTKKAAEIAAKKLVEQARKKADDLNKKAEADANAKIQEAADKVKL